ncbi:AAA-type ATPase, N-terminal domain [Dillenia turbinata]|uniref:AAA-type ATPase, N-terminal domain n=1 Tax=Dillenia turbinata TaxID=194707 RepID=A0AAN8VB14_9MAGN
MIIEIARIKIWPHVYLMEKSKRYEVIEWEVQEELHQKDVIACDVINPDHIDVEFNSIGGLETIKQALCELVILPLRRPELFSHGKLLGPQKGVLLYGPPGTGKTMLAKAIAKESGAVFINVRISNLMSKWFGDAQKLVAAVFSLAYKLQPAIIFIDEVDSFLGQRRSSDHEAMTNMKTEFMALWDGFTTDQSARVTVLAATNRPSELDEAILRRLPQAFEIGIPDQKERVEILKVILKGERVEDDIDYDYISSLCEGYTGSDLLELCKKAAYYPIRDLLDAEKSGRGSSVQRPLSQEDLEKVLKTYRKTKAAANEFSRLSSPSPIWSRNREPDDYQMQAAINELSKVVVSQIMNLQSDPQDPDLFQQPHVSAIQSFLKFWHPNVILIILSKTALLYVVKKWWRVFEDRCHVYQSFKIPEHNDLYQENQLYRKVHTYLSSLTSVEDSDYANLFSGNKSNEIQVHFDQNDVVLDTFLSAGVYWKNEKNEKNQSRVFVLKVRRRDKRRILRPYLQHIHTISDEIEQRKKELRLYINSEAEIGFSSEERIMIFTMNTKEQIDPQILRPGRIDFHLHFPLCDFPKFKSLANSHLGLKDHKLFPQVEEIFQTGASLSPAEIGEIMISNRYSPSRALKTVITALQSNKQNGTGPGLTHSSSGRVEEVGEPGGVICRESVHTVREFRKLYGLLRRSRRQEGSMDLGSAEKEN